METIIKKAIEGGYKSKEKTIHNQIGYDKVIVLDPLFWQALGRACGWEGFYASKDDDTWGLYNIWDGKHQGLRDTGIEVWKYHALRFHEINLTEGWDRAILYLSELTKEDK